MILEITLELVLSTTVLCHTLLPGSVLKQPETYQVGKALVHLSGGVVYRKWDLDLDGHADVMTTHLIDPTQLERYKQLSLEGTNYDLQFTFRPTLYWIDFTGHDSWDRIYIDREDNGRCELYASKDQAT